MCLYSMSTIEGRVFQNEIMHNRIISNLFALHVALVGKKKHER